MYIIIQRESPLIFIKNHGESSWRKKQNYAVSVLLELPNPIRWKKREPFSHVHKTNLYDKKKTIKIWKGIFFMGIPWKSTFILNDAQDTSLDR